MINGLTPGWQQLCSTDVFETLVSCKNQWWVLWQMHKWTDVLCSQGPDKGAWMQMAATQGRIRLRLGGIEHARRAQRWERIVWPGGLGGHTRRFSHV